MEYKAGMTITPDFDYKNQLLTFTEKSYGIMDRIVKQQIDFKEECVRKALIDLGWTPPPSSHNSN